MHRLAVAAGGILGLLLVPLAMSTATSWLVLPAHLLMCMVGTTDLVSQALRGRGDRARAWGVWILLATLGAGGSLQLSSWAGEGWSWMLPWSGLLCWAWVPPVLAVVLGRMGDGVSALRSQAAVRRRRA